MLPVSRCNTSIPQAVYDHRFANLHTSMITDTRTAQQPPDNVDSVFHLAMR